MGSGCSSKYCISGTGTIYDDTYSYNVTHNSKDSFLGDTNGYYIFYSTGETCWCLSTVLDGSCLLFGKTPCVSNCPDLCDDFFFSEACPTPTPSPSVCATIDFDAIFDCEVTPTPTPTPTQTPTPTPTPTPTYSDPCGGVGISVSAITYTPTPTPTPTQTPTGSPEVTRPCNYSGLVVFTTLDEYIRCSNSKQFRDCYTGQIYSTTDVVLSPIGGQPLVGFVYSATINDVDACVTFIGINSSISGSDNITLNVEYGLESEGNCLSCIPPVTPSPTPTPTTTPTPTPTSSPAVCKNYKVTNLLPTSNTYTITQCTKNELLTNGIAGNGVLTNVCSLTTPTGTNIVVELLGNC